MERWYRHYGIATYGPAPNWRWRSGHRPATQGLPKPVLGLLLEAVNGLRQRLSCDGSRKSPWGARNAPEYHPPDPDSNDRSSRCLGVVQNHNRPKAVMRHRELRVRKQPFAARSKLARIVSPLFWNKHEASWLSCRRSRIHRARRAVDRI